LPSINAMAKELEPDGFTLLLIDLGEEARRVARAVNERRYSAPVALDAHMKAAEAYRVRGTPTVVLVGRNGHVLGTAVGPTRWTGPAGRALLRRLLGDDRSSAR